MTIAKIPARIVSGRPGQAATTLANAGSSNNGTVALSVARGGREPLLAVASCRKTACFSCDAIPSLSAGLDVTCRQLSPEVACTEKVETAGIAPAVRG